MSKELRWLSAPGEMRQGCFPQLQRRHGPGYQWENVELVIFDKEQLDRERKLIEYGE